jgi:hypothetical protein
MTFPDGSAYARVIGQSDAATVTSLAKNLRRVLAGVDRPQPRRSSTRALTRLQTVSLASAIRIRPGTPRPLSKQDESHIAASKESASCQDSLASMLIGRTELLVSE